MDKLKFALMEMLNPIFVQGLSPTYGTKLLVM